MTLSGPVRGSVLALCALCVVLIALPGCAAHRAREAARQAKLTPAELYKRAKHDLDNNNFSGAIKTYESLTARFPFTDEARQARIDLIYAYYRANEGESATDAADAFIRENPTHPRVDYAYYIKGLVDFEHTPNALESLFHADMSKRPPTTARKAFAAFKIVVEQYPKSEYAHDSLQRMVYLRNRLANYEVHVAQYYLKRGAYIAAAQRAKGAIEQYDGAPAVREALAILIQCYDRLGLKPLADQAREVYAANYSTRVAQSQPAVHHSWWRFW
jgi:outer membrane protein assembly factor BamD